MQKYARIRLLYVNLIGKLCILPLYYASNTLLHNSCIVFTVYKVVIRWSNLSLLKSENFSSAFRLPEHKNFRHVLSSSSHIFMQPFKEMMNKFLWNFLKKHNTNLKPHMNLDQSKPFVKVRSLQVIKAHFLHPAL